MNNVYSTIIYHKGGYIKVIQTGVYPFFELCRCSSKNYKKNATSLSCQILWLLVQKHQKGLSPQFSATTFQPRGKGFVRRWPKAPPHGASANTPYPFARTFAPPPTPPEFGDRPRKTLDFTAYRGVCPQKRVQGRGSKIPIDGERHNMILFATETTVNETDIS